MNINLIISYERIMRSAQHYPASKQTITHPAKDQKLAGLPLLLVVITSIAVYLPSLFNGFVWDGNIQILNNHWITSPKYAGDVFFSNVAGFSRGYVTKLPAAHVH